MVCVVFLFVASCSILTLLNFSPIIDIIGFATQRGKAYCKKLCLSHQPSLAKKQKKVVIPVTAHVEVYTTVACPPLDNVKRRHKKKEKSSLRLPK